jgi:hypothetical protein
MAATLGLRRCCAAYGALPAGGSQHMGGGACGTGGQPGREEYHAEHLACERLRPTVQV